ncbi:MAG: leucine-rich repeat protein, partial [Treponema sp.]
MESCFRGCTSLTQAPEIPSNVTIMEGCFYNCEKLTQAPVIPSSVTNMKSCFSGCKSLTQAPVIPSNVTNMKLCFSGCEKITAVTLKCNYVNGRFDYTFYGCGSLSANSIKVPAGQLETYKDNADKMNAQKEWFVAE